MRFRILNGENLLFDYREAGKVTQGIDLWEDELNDKAKPFYPKDEVAYWIKQFVTNHSTIRCVHFRVTAKAPKSVIMQVIRATKGTPRPYVQSSRPDWNGRKERSSNPYEELLYIHDHTAESFIEMCKLRLCERTEERTRKFVQEMVFELRDSKEPFLRAVGLCCHANCWWHNGLCPELKGCEGMSKLSQKIIDMYGVGKE